MGCFLIINHSADYRPQARAARDSRALRQDQDRLNEPDDSGEMLRNEFVWGQQSHILSLVYHVAGCDDTEGGGRNGELVLWRIYCAMTHRHNMYLWYGIAHFLVMHLTYPQLKTPN
ncbi:hypothetical protein ACHAWF_004721 [Thalassiosira exigua]